MGFAPSYKYQVVKYTGLQLQTSTSTACVPLVWGANQVAGNLIWYGDFQAKANKTKGKGGGKETTSYNYSASIIMALSQGPVHGVGKVWVNQSEISTFSSTGFSLFLGTTPQSPWSYMTSKHPTEAMGYNGVAYMAKSNYQMGTSPTLPSTQLELQGMRYGSQSGGDGNDADCALIVQDYLGSDFEWSVGLPDSIFDNLLSTPAATTTGDSAYQTYCQAMGFGFSPALVSQETALSVLDRWTQLTNTAVFWSGYSLKFVPYGDTTLTAHGVTYLPPITPIYNLTDSDYVRQENDDPVKCLRSDPADAYNSVKITIKDRSNYYADTPVILQDQNLVELYGLRQDSAAQASEVCVTTMATIMVQLRLTRKAYIRNTYEFQLPWKYCLVEPMDVVTITDANLGYNELPIRITGVEEDDQGNLKIEAEQLTVGVSTASGFSPQPITNHPQNSATVPDSVNPPVIFEPPSSMTNGIAEVWIALSGGDGTTFDPNWGGCQIWISTDGSSYTTMIGEVDSASNMGILTSSLASYGGSNPDTANTLAVSTLMSDGELIGGTSTDAANGMLLSYVDGELISYENATLTGTDTYNLTTLYRGMYGTSAGSHSSGTKFARLDNVFKYQLPAAYIGHTLYFKFPSFNIWGLQLQDLSTCTAYTLTPVGTGFGGGSAGVPVAPTGLSVSTGGIVQAVASWNANATTDNVTLYKLYRAAGSGAFGSASVVWSGLALGRTDSPLSPNTTYTYYLTAVNAVGESLPTSGVTITTSTVALLGAIYVPSTYYPGIMPATARMLYHKVAEACTVNANLSGWQAGGSANATSSVTILVERALAASPNTFSTIGTITIGAGSITPTFATVSGIAYTLAVGDVLRISGPSSPDATYADAYVTALLTRTS